MKLKVVCLNLWLGGILMDEALEFLRQQDADLVLLQEVYNGADASLEPQYRSMQVLKQALDYPYQDFKADYLDITRADGKAQRGNAILSKLPIIKTGAKFLFGEYSEMYQDVPGNYHNCPRSMQHAVVETPVGQMNVYNLQGVWDLAGDSFSQPRKEMFGIMIQETMGVQNVIVAGDTNATPDNQAVSNIERCLHSVFGRELKSTFNMRRKDLPGYATAVVDMILTSPNIQTISKSCPDVDISDHLPLVAELEIPKINHRTTDRLELAKQKAKYAHEGQYRKLSGAPYIIHPLEVSELCALVGANEDAVIAALLHDVIEDVSPDRYSRQDIVHDFGENVAALIDVVTEDKSIDDWREHKQGYLKSIETTTHLDALTVCAADKINNLESLLESEQQFGGQIWEKFGGGKPGQIWWMESVHEILAKRIPDNPLVARLAQGIAKIK